MQSLFNPPDNQEIVRRIGNLTATTAQMNSSQTMAHCSKALQTAFGDVKLSRSCVGYLFVGIGKKKILSDEPFGMNMPTDKRLLNLQANNFDAMRRELVALVERFARGGPQGITDHTHGF